MVVVGLVVVIVVLLVVDVVVGGVVVLVVVVVVVVVDEIFVDPFGILGTVESARSMDALSPIELYRLNIDPTLFFFVLLSGL